MDFERVNGSWELRLALGEMPIVHGGHPPRGHGLRSPCLVHGLSSLSRVGEWNLGLCLGPLIRLWGRWRTGWESAVPLACCPDREVAVHWIPVTVESSV